MNDLEVTAPPLALDAIARDTAALGFTMASEHRTGSLLRVLAASKPSGRLLELGTGTGVATAWLLAGMDETSHLDSVDNDATVLEVARRHLSEDRRVRFHLADGASFMAQSQPGHYDLVFADSWPGKFTHLERALALVKPGGIYVIDDLLPQPNWPAEHAPKVPALIHALEHHPDFVSTRLAWASGLMILVRRG